MKITNYLPLAVATLAIASGNTALAGRPSSQTYSATPITFSLVISTQGEPTYSESSNTYTAVVNQQRYGNVQILQMLKDEGVIQGVTGWSIVLVSSSSEEDSLVGFYLTKVGKEPININSYLGFDLAGADVKTGTSKTVYGEISYTVTDNYSHSLLSVLYIGQDAGTLAFFGNTKYKTLSTYTYYEGPTDSTHNINSFNLSNGTGFYGYEGPFGGSLVTGKVTGPTSAGTPFYINIF